MDNTLLLYNNALSLNLKQAMNNVNDVLYNMQSLKQFQWRIDQIQKMKDGAQIQVNMAVLALWRNFVLDEGLVGARLLRNLVRNYYPLNDGEIDDIHAIVNYPCTILASMGQRLGTFLHNDMVCLLDNLQGYLHDCDHGVGDLNEIMARMAVY